MDLETSVKAVGKETYDAFTAAIGADTISFAGLSIGLSRDNFTPEVGMPVPVVATGNGLDPLTSSGNVLLASTDPTTGDRIYKVKPPAGGWYWIVAGDPAPPEVIYGWVVYKSTDVIVAGKFPLPITLDETGQSIEFDSIEIRLPFNGLQ